MENSNEKSLGSAADVRSQLEAAAARMAELKAAEKELRAAEKAAEKAAAEKAAADKAAGIEPEKKEKAPAKPKFDVLAAVLVAIATVENVDDETKAIFHNAVLAAMPKSKEEDEKPKTEGPGVIKSIIKIIADAGPEGISKNDILKELVARFPGRDQFSMVSTVRALLIPSRIKKEEYLVIALPNGNFRGVAEAEVKK